MIDIDICLDCYLPKSVCAVCDQAHLSGRELARRRKLRDETMKYILDGVFRKRPKTGGKTPTIPHGPVMGGEG